MKRPIRIAAALVALACAAPATAGAATISEENGALVYRGEGAEGLSLLVSDRDAETWGDVPKPHRLSFSDSGADRIQINTALCAPEETYSGVEVGCEFSTSRPIVVEGSEGDDAVSIFSADDVPDSIPVTIRGNGGNDVLKDAYNGQAGRALSGGAGSDKIEGYAGADVIDGGDGDDPLLDGGEGNDVVRGGEGSDLLWGDHYKAPGADVLDGGGGIDLIDGEWNIPSGDFHPPATVTLDGQANDGRPGEGDNVVAVEKINGYVSMTFVGTDAPEVVDMVNPADDGTSTLRGMGGNDRLIAKDSADTVDGGAGDDHVEGGWGHDTLTGGPGRDMIYGDQTMGESCWYSCSVPFGNDTIDARDGAVDTVDCGVGQDTALVDAVDVVAACESVQVAGAPAPGGGQGGGQERPAGGKPTPAKPAVALVGGSRMAALAKGRLAVRVACAGACKVTARLVVRKAIAAAGSKTLLRKGTATVRLKPVEKVARKLVRRKKAAATVRITVRSASGRSAVSRKVTLKR